MLCRHRESEVPMERQNASGSKVDGTLWRSRGPIILARNIIESFLKGYSHRFAVEAARTE